MAAVRNGGGVGFVGDMAPSGGAIGRFVEAGCIGCDGRGDNSPAHRRSRLASFVSHVATARVGFGFPVSSKSRPAGGTYDWAEEAGS